MEQISNGVMMVVVIGLYALPSIIAASRKHHNERAIIALNIFLGWTFLGWVGALVWALTVPPSATVAPPPVPQASRASQGISFASGALIIASAAVAAALILGNIGRF